MEIKFWKTKKLLKKKEIQMAELKEPYEQYDPKKSYPRHYAAHPNGMEMLL